MIEKQFILGINGGVAQSVEQVNHNHWVGGSIPSAAISFSPLNQTPLLGMKKGLPSGTEWHPFEPSSK
jgi:hypothetical protein